MAGEARGFVKIDRDECKGCGVCLESCPPKCLEIESEMNQYGVRAARYMGAGCTGCGICYFCCPEPGAITVYRAVTGKAVKEKEKEGGARAAAL
jgi:MinD superfamily P-loop ATPase